MILERTIVSSINAKDILLFDSNFLMFYLRKISYGDEYSFEITCSNSSCEKKFEHTTLISSLTFEELPKDIVEPIIIKLPRSGYTIESILPRLYHSEDIVMKNSNRKKTTDDDDRRLLDNMLVTTLNIYDPDGKSLEKKEWEEFFEALPGTDTGTIRKAVTFSTGVDKLTGVRCPYCESEYTGTIPIGPEFFRF
jgi:hypothetical protein